MSPLPNCVAPHDMPFLCLRTARSCRHASHLHVAVKDAVAAARRHNALVQLLRVPFRVVQHEACVHIMQLVGAAQHKVLQCGAGTGTQLLDVHIMPAERAG